MEDALWFADGVRHVEGIENDPCLEVSREGLPDASSRPGVQNDREIKEADHRRDEGDVGNPQLVRPLGDKIAPHEIMRGMTLWIALRRDRRASAAADA